MFPLQNGVTREAARAAACVRATAWRTPWHTCGHSREAEEPLTIFGDDCDTPCAAFPTGSGVIKYASRARRLTRLIQPTTRVLSDGLPAPQMDAEFYFAYDERVKWRELAAVRCPVLVVRGADSHLWDDASVDKVLGTLTHGYGAKAIIPNAGHWVVRTSSPDQFTTINVHSDTIKSPRVGFTLECNTPFPVCQP
jgi:hypothetical protein